MRAAVQFVRALVTSRGAVSDEEFAAARDAGFSDGAVVELVAHTAMTTFTNYLNRVARTELDFPAALPFAPAKLPI